LIYNLLYEQFAHVPGFTLFQYITFRTIGATLTALVLSLLIGPWMIDRLTRFNIGQTVRDDGPEAHLLKSGTPTMGGTLILVALIVPSLLWADLESPYVWVVLLGTTGFGIIGFIDDYLKLAKGDPRGIGAANKLVGQLAIATAAAVTLYAVARDPSDTLLVLPLFKELTFQLGWLYVPLGVLVVVATSRTRPSTSRSRLSASAQAPQSAGLTASRPVPSTAVFLRSNCSQARSLIATTCESVSTTTTPESRSSKASVTPIRLLAGERSSRRWR